MTQPIRTIVAYYETEGRNAVSPLMAQELCEETANRLAPHVGPIAIDLQGTHVPDNPVELGSPYLKGPDHTAFFTKGAVGLKGDAVHGTSHSVGPGGLYTSQFLLTVPRVSRVSSAFKARTQAVATHEMGHTFGLLDHCPIRECVMYPEVSIFDKYKLIGEAFCSTCIDGLQHNRQIILEVEAARKRAL